MLIADPLPIKNRLVSVGFLCNKLVIIGFLTSGSFVSYFSTKPFDYKKLQEIKLALKRLHCQSQIQT